MVNEGDRMISKDDFKLSMDIGGGYYPTVHPDMIKTPVTGVALGELLCPVPACVNEENPISGYQHLKYIRYGTSEPFNPDNPEQIIIAFNGECGHDWELVFETYKGRMKILILNVEDRTR
tara:strand:+ start:38 stop:397 length:360 start_codon:yes stop_codon:yes gene_type:complete